MAHDDLGDMMTATRTRDQWAPVWKGMDFELAAMEGKLRASDIPAVIAPVGEFYGLAGGGHTTAELHVPVERYAEAREVLGLPALGSEPLDPEDARRERLFERGNRIVYAAVLGAGVPFVPGLVGLWMGSKYVLDARVLAPKPNWYWLHVAAIPVCALTLPWGWMLMRAMGWTG